MIRSTANHVISAVVQRSLSSSWGIQVLQWRKGALLKGELGLWGNRLYRCMRWLWYIYTHTRMFQEHTKSSIHDQTLLTQLLYLLYKRYIASTHNGILQFCSNDCFALVNPPVLHQQLRLKHHWRYWNKPGLKYLLFYTKLNLKHNIFLYLTRVIIEP